jgi:hypothetical protein
MDGVWTSPFSEQRRRNRMSLVFTFGVSYLVNKLLTLAQYMADVCERYQIVDKIQLNTDVKELRWIEDDEKE